MVDWGVSVQRATESGCDTSSGVGRRTTIAAEASVGGVTELTGSHCYCVCCRRT